MTPAQIVDDMKSEFLGVGPRKARKYVGGLLPAFCEFLTELGTPGKAYADFAAFVADFPLITVGTSTLTVSLPSGGQKTIRPAYDRVHTYFIFTNKRLDYPRSEPYATGKWGDYVNWLDSLVTFSQTELDWVRESAFQFVLDTLPEATFDPGSIIIDQPIFKILLEQFDFNDRAKGEPNGAAFQAMVFGYVRADAPHLQVEARKVHTGGARLKGIGDIDAWEADRLILTAEVKHYKFNDVPSLEHYGQEVRKRGSLGLVIADGFADDAAEAIVAIGLVPLEVSDLINIVRLWDPLKQKAALNAFLWVIIHIEQKSGLIARVEKFLRDVGYYPPVLVEVPSSADEDI